MHDTSPVQTSPDRSGVVAPAADVHVSLWHPVLLIATVLTTMWAGAAHVGIDLLTDPGRWQAGVPYSLALLAILGVHELGHFVVARRRGIRVSLPYFIPAPVLLGTFGAFIQLRGAVRNRATYFDVAVAGPLAGLVVAVLVILIDVRSPVPVAHGGIIPASSALFAAVYTLAGGANLDAPITLGPLAFAGYIGLIVTALNLAPIGQLDGGHMAYAMLGQRRARVLSLAIIGALVVAGLLWSGHYLMWAFIVWLFAGGSHPPALDETQPLRWGRIALGWTALFVLLAIVFPLPRIAR